MRPRSAALLVVLAACASRPVARPPAGERAPPVLAQGGVTPAAPVVVAIVVDQLAAWVAAERLPLLADGGFARLRREGTWVRDLAYLHAVTETAPGHAALFTGRTPRENGIFGNAAPRRDLGAGRHGAAEAGSLLDDPSRALVGPEGPTARSGVSLALLRQGTLADALVQRDPEAVVVALSLKDRGAVFGGGRRPAASLWYDATIGALVTSTAFARALPAWARAHARPLDRQHTSWEPLDAAFVRRALTPDDQPGESTAWRGRRTFPHELPPPPGDARAFRATPMSDAFLIDLALDAVRQARRPDHPMLLSLSLSANDYIGHAFGPDSWEAWDELARLDVQLGRFLAELDGLLGPDGYAIVLSGDHGVAPLPEVQAQVQLRKVGWCAATAPDPYQRPCAAPGRRLSEAEVRRALEAAAEAAIPGGGPAIERVMASRVYLTAAARRLPADRRRALDRAIVERARAEPGLADALPLAELAGDCGPAADEGVRALVCRATTEGAGDYYLVQAPGSFWGGREGSNHGTPYRYDRLVPLLVRYPRGAGGRVVDRAVFGSYYASAWYALTGERVAGPYGEVVGAGP